VDLQEFVTQTLVSIVLGVQGAQDTVPGGEARIAPVLTSFASPLHRDVVGSSADRTPVLLAEFDVAVTINEGEGQRATISVSTGSVTVGSGEKASAMPRVSRVRFSVPLALPAAHCGALKR
jgi:hypothetical protein